MDNNIKAPKINNIINVYSSKFLNVFEVGFKDKKNNDKKWIVASRLDKEKYIDKVINKMGKDRVDAVIIVGYKNDDKRPSQPVNQVANISPEPQDQDTIVLIREFRIPINDYIYSLPAGLVDPGDDIYETAIREMKEETGLDLIAIDKDKTCNKAYASVGMSDESLAIVYGRVEGSLSRDFMEDTELIEPMCMTKEEVKDLLTKKDVNIDIKAWLILKEFAGS
jgi:hydrolase, NUDIX family